MRCLKGAPGWCDSVVHNRPLDEVPWTSTSPHPPHQARHEAQTDAGTGFVAAERPFIK